MQARGAAGLYPLGALLGAMSSTQFFQPFFCSQACPSPWLLQPLPRCSPRLSASGAALLDVASAWLSAARGEKEERESGAARRWGSAQGHRGLARGSGGPGAACLRMLAPRESLAGAHLQLKGWRQGCVRADTESGCSRFYLKRLPWRDARSCGTEGWHFTMETGQQPGSLAHRGLGTLPKPRSMCSSTLRGL